MQTFELVEKLALMPTYDKCVIRKFGTDGRYVDYPIENLDVERDSSTNTTYIELKESESKT